VPLPIMDLSFPFPCSAFPNLSRMTSLFRDDISAGDGSPFLFSSSCVQDFPGRSSEPLPLKVSLPSTLLGIRCYQLGIVFLGD